ncbi:MAG TPA: alpha/beta hydrolase [Steroidobacteraceae bacterium]|nr:alpha/beta hydrolase [Steroidobacteraceae bacterium]
MPVDPLFQSLLDMPAMQLAPPPPGMSAAMLRAAMRALPAPVVTPPPIHAIRNVTVPGPAGSLAVRLYYPSAAARLPLIVFFHGGGFVLCDLETHDPLCRSLALESGAVVASVDYRLAPECRFPGPLEDCYAALGALVRQGREHGVDSSRLAVCGDSAGGNLAAAAALLVRERGGPRLRHQALLYPVLDAACETASMAELSVGYMLSRAVMQWYWNCYLSQPADAANPLASPLRAESLAGLPPATVVTAEFDPLRDEGERYAERLRSAGVPVTARRYLGMIHGFASMPYITPVADRAIADVARDLRESLEA